MVAVGIDFGSYKSCIAIWCDGNVEIISNKNGNRITPSYISFTDDCRIFGDNAKNRCSMNPVNTIYGIMRLIGKKYNTKTVQEDIKNWPFVVIERNKKIFIQVEHKNEIKYVTPEEILVMKLQYLKKLIEEQYGEVTMVCVSIPCSFFYHQMEIIKDVISLSGFKRSRIIHSFAACSIAYGFNSIIPITKEKTICVIDIGACFVNVGLVAIECGIYEVKKMNGNSHIGGDDYDTRLVNYMIKQFQSKHGFDISSNPRSMRRLRTACGNAKHLLSVKNNTTITIDSLYNGIDFHFSITRDIFESLCKDLFLKVIETIENVFANSYHKRDIEDIIVIGGSSRIPKLQTMIKSFFKVNELSKKIHSDESIALGNAVDSAIGAGIDHIKLNNLLLLPKYPHTLGISSIKDKITDDDTYNNMNPLIVKNTTIPTKKSQNFTSNIDNQKRCNIHVFEGENPQVKYNLLLNTTIFEDIMPGKIEDTKIEVALDIDANFNLSLTITDLTSKKRVDTIIKNGLTLKEIKQIQTSVEQFNKDDITYQTKLDAKHNLEDKILYYRNYISETKNLKNKINIEKILDEISNWMDTTYTMKEAFVYNQKQDEIENVVHSKPNEFPGDKDKLIENYKEEIRELKNRLTTISTDYTKEIEQLKIEFTNEKSKIAIKKQKNIIRQKEVSYNMYRNLKLRNWITGNKISSANFKNLIFLGKGCNGLVMKATISTTEKENNNYTVALKMITNIHHDATIAHKNRVENEYKILPMLLQLHPNIVRKIAEFISKPTNEMINNVSEDIRDLCYREDGEIKGAQFFILEYYEKTLKSTIKNLSSNKIIKYATHLARGLLYLYESKIVHLDIKSDNLMISSSDDLVIVDFGVSGVLQYDKTVDYRKTIGGNTYHLAPEVINARDKGYNLPCELQYSWELGMILYQLLSKGRHPFDVYGNKCPVEIPYLDLTNIPKQYHTLLSQLLCEKGQRISILDAWIQLENLYHNSLM